MLTLAQPSTSTPSLKLVCQAPTHMEPALMNTVKQHSLHAPVFPLALEAYAAVADVYTPVQGSVHVNNTSSKCCKGKEGN